jgi:hypothetical protein
MALYHHSIPSGLPAQDAKRLTSRVVRTMRAYLSRCTPLP